MTAIHASTSENRQRNPFSNSLSPQNERRRETLLRDAFVAIVKPFECRPEPRSAWDHAVDLSESRWNKLVIPIRKAILAAQAEEDVSTLTQVMEAACAFCDALKADFTSLIPDREESSIVSLALLEAECSGSVQVEAMRLVSSPTSTEAERAIQPLIEEESALMRLINRVQRLAREPQIRVAR